MTLDARTKERRAILMLLLACVVWGMGFQWNKRGQAIIGERLAQQANDPAAHDLGPAWFLAIRFTFAAILWIIVFPSARRSWTRSTMRGGIVGGIFLAAGMLLQHYGLAHTSESLSSFLTSLTVLFTPFLAVFLLRQRVSVWMWASVACATAGVALMTLYREEARFDIGALLGLLCAAAFSGHILVIDRFGQHESPWRLCLAQLGVASSIFVVFAFVWGFVNCPMSLSDVARAASDKTFLVYLGLTTIPGTLLTFGLMFRYQPDTSATRAALTYLSEPIFATTYAWIIAGTSLTNAAMVGAGLIFIGNLFAELLGRRTNGAHPRAASPTVAGPLLD